MGLGLNYYHKMENDTAIVHFEKAFLLSQDLGDIEDMGESLFDIAEAYLEQSKYTLAMTNYYGALQSLQRLATNRKHTGATLGWGLCRSNVEIMPMPLFAMKSPPDCRGYRHEAPGCLCSITLGLSVIVKAISARQ